MPGRETGAFRHERTEFDSRQQDAKEDSRFGKPRDFQGESSHRWDAGALGGFLKS